jgi:predicted GH43/DUF377 family glycosyl hydrolase
MKGINIGIGIGIGRKRKGWSRYWESLISATVENDEPTKIVLTFGVTPKFPVSYFTVTGHNVLSLTRAGNILTLTLSTPIIYFDDLYVRFKDYFPFHITNNVIDDGDSVFDFEPARSGGALRNATGLESIWYDMLRGSTQRGAEQDSGDTIIYAVYEITATQVNFFYTGCAVGDIFPAANIKTCDANNKVKRVLGNHITQPDITAKRPKFGTFDGVVQFMRTPLIADFVQPEFLYIVFRQLSWTDGEPVIDGNTNYSLLLRQASGGSTPELEVYAGESSAKKTLPINSFGIVRILVNGANSIFQLNADAAWTGNLGASHAGGLAVGRFAVATTKFGNIEIKRIIGRKSADAATYRDSLYTALYNKYHGAWAKGVTVLQADTVEEGDNIYEPTVIYEDNPQILTGETNVFKMWYTGGWGTHYINYAESVDGLTWTKHASNPILSNYSRSCVIKNGAEYRMYTADETGAHIDLYTSFDGITFALEQANCIIKGEAGTWDATTIANSSVIKDGDNWYMVYDGYNSTIANVWKVGMATSLDGKIWTKVGKIIDEAGTKGAAFLKKIGSYYYIWCLGCENTSTLPSDFYRYKSLDMMTWERDVADYTFRRSEPDEGNTSIYGQVADPCLMEFNGKVYLFYAASSDGSRATGEQHIKLSIADMKFEELVKTQEGNIFL